MIDLNHNSGFNPGRDIASTPSEQRAIGEAITEAIDAALLADRDATPPRQYLGASMLGDPCARKIYYQAMNVAPDAGSEIAGRTLRIFALGHVFEDVIADLLKRAGFDLRVKNARGEQYGFEAAAGRIAGHIDGAIVRGPIALPYPLGWECKSLNAKSWSDTAKCGVRFSKETYYGQMQLYMAYLDLDVFLFTAVNKDTAELYHELVPFDPPAAQRLSDRATEILRAMENRELPARVAVKQDFYLCRWCQFQKRCWSDTP